VIRDPGLLAFQVGGSMLAGALFVLLAGALFVLRTKIRKLFSRGSTAQ
jgi:hypothetical protein